MKLYSYIVKNDGGFAPNPFFGYCTLACCKPGIRKKAELGDWIIGLTPKARGHKIVYFMQVEQDLTFDKYWKDHRFKVKRPTKGADRVAELGDNIYKPSKDSVDGYVQRWSAHSGPKGFGKTENPDTKQRDLKGKRVLISQNFTYFGSKPADLPKTLNALIVARNHTVNRSEDVIRPFLEFEKGHHGLGVLARPHQWTSKDETWKSHACS